MPRVKRINYDTARVTPNLEPNRRNPPHRGFGWKKLTGKATPATAVAHKADGHRLWIASTSNPFIVYSVVAALGYIVALASSIGELVVWFRGDWEPSFATFLLATSLLVGIVSTFLLFSKSEIRYFIFDRDHGTVAIPKGLFRPHYVLPFSEVECYGASYLSPHGAQLYDMILYPKLKPRGRWEGFRKLYMEAIYDHDTADRYWSYICLFMDRQKPLPLSGLTGMLMRFLMENDARVEDLGTDKIPKEKVEEYLQRLYGMANREKKRRWL